jgi:hypothetical protein
LIKRAGNRELIKTLRLADMQLALSLGAHADPRILEAGEEAEAQKRFYYSARAIKGRKLLEMHSLRTIIFGT